MKFEWTGRQTLIACIGFVVAAAIVALLAQSSALALSIAAAFALALMGAVYLSRWRRRRGARTANRDG